MRKLASISNLMNDPKSREAASREDGDIGGKGAGPKKHSEGAKIVNKKKRHRSANVGKEVECPVAEKAGYTDQARINRFSNHENSSPGQPVSTQCGKRVFTGKKVLTQPGLAPCQRGPSQSAKRVQCGERIHSSTGERVPSPTGQHAYTQSGQHARIQAQPHSEQGAGHGAEQPQSRLNSPARSGQSTPNQSHAQSRRHTPEHAPTQSHPSTVNVSSTAVTTVGRVGRWNIGSENRDGRIRVEVVDGTLEPSYKCSAKNRQIMYEQLEPTGYNWKAVSKKTQDFYFEEFKKYFAWRQSDAVIYKGWLRNARLKYSELVSHARSSWENHKKRDNRIGENVYLSWVEFWKGSDFQKKSLIQKKNRRSGVDGHPSTHTSGSASHRTVAARMKVQFKRDPTADELFRETHTRRVKKKKILAGEDNEIGMDDEDDNDDEGYEVVWIDKKSQKIYETFEKMVEKREKIGEPYDRNEVFLQAVGGLDKKNRVYGVGSSQGLFYQSKTRPCISSSIIAEENELLKEELVEVKDRMKAMEDQIAKLIEATSVRVPHLQSPTDFDGQSPTDSEGQDDDN